MELMNFFHFDGVEMTLRRITLSGVSLEPSFSSILPLPARSRVSFLVRSPAGLVSSTLSTISGLPTSRPTSSRRSSLESLPSVPSST